ncbi:MAG: nuclear transport factor 2 family protein [bacterium]
MNPLTGVELRTVARQDAESLERQFNAAMEEAETGASLDAARRIYAEFERDGDPAASGLVHRSFELHCEAQFLTGETYRGAKGYIRWREQMEEIFEEDAFEPQGVIFGSGGFVVLGRLRVKPADGGVEVDEPFAHRHEQKDGRLVRLTLYSDLERALEDAGIIPPY